MKNIATKGLRKSFNTKVLLTGVNLTVSEGRKIALVGENGVGKSTLLKILCGLIQPDSGSVFGLENGCTYIAQDFSGKDSETPQDFLRARVEKLPKATKLLEQYGFDLGPNHERLHMRCGDLSGGEKKKLEICAGLASGATFLAMDEPENHLDYQTIERLIATLSRFNGGLIFVSHDQYFIDCLADTIFELEDGDVTAYSMRYDEYLAEKERQIGGQARQWEIEEKTIHRLRDTVEMMKRRAARNSDTAKTYQQTKRRLQELKDSHGTRPTAEPERPKITLTGVEQKKGKIIVSIRDLTFSYGRKRIFSKANAVMRFGDRVVLFGPNGSGKSTLINLLTGQLQPQHGHIEIGVNVKWQMMTQDHLAGLDANQTPLSIFQSLLRWPEHRCRACLAKYGIKSDQVLRPLHQASGGQRARFKLAILFAQEPEFLILDEPTNHVDPPTWDAIVSAITEYNGTALIVTHDRAFIDAVAKKLWVLGDGAIQEWIGTLSEYLER